MKSIFKFDNRALLSAVSGIIVLSLVGGCGGGGGGSSTPTTPTPFDATYNPVFTPNDAVPSDGKAPTGTLRVVNGRATGTATFFLQTSVVTRVQSLIDKGLNDNGVGSDIPNNQVPANIQFDFSKNLDSSGKVVLTSTESVKVCGSATLTIDSTLSANGSGIATYRITFPPRLTLKIRGRDFPLNPPEGTPPLTCNNLPNRIGTVTLTR